jgi:hypothetical protein
MENLPFWTQLIRTPDLSVALMNEWESKIERIARITIEEDVANITGVPSWMMVLLNRVMELKGYFEYQRSMPNRKLFVHGGVSFVIP